jgi:spore coat polysaccharide biosynthesis predicted glycosyltransferase SpsG
MIIFTEAGGDIGLGHITRMHVVYDAATKAGVNTKIILFDKDGTYTDDNFIYKGNWIQNKDLITKFDADIAVVDSYLATHEAYRFIDSKFSFSVAVDDYNRMIYPVNLIINPNVFFSRINYQNQISKSVGGHTFTLLRGDFDNYQLISKNQSPDNILTITVGGSDYRDLTPKILAALDGVFNGNINVVSPQPINFNLNDSRVRILPKQTANELIKLFQQSKIVISACGQTLHELASMGKATIGICIDIDQEPNQKYYLDSGFLRSDISWDSSSFKQDIQDAIKIFDNLKNIDISARIGPKLVSLDGGKNFFATVMNYATAKLKDQIISVVS